MPKLPDFHFCLAYISYNWIMPRTANFYDNVYDCSSCKVFAGGHFLRRLSNQSHHNDLHHFSEMNAFYQILIQSELSKGVLSLY